MRHNATSNVRAGQACTVRACTSAVLPSPAQYQSYSNPKHLLPNSCAVRVLHPGVTAVLTARAPAQTPARMPPTWVRRPSAPGQSGRPRTRQSTCRWQARSAPAPGRTRGRARTRPERAASAPPRPLYIGNLVWKSAGGDTDSQSMANGRRAHVNADFTRCMPCGAATQTICCPHICTAPCFPRKQQSDRWVCPGPCCMRTSRAMLLG